MSRDKITPIGVVKRPTVPEQNRVECIAIMEELLERVKRGDFDEIAIIISNSATKEWEEHTSSTLSITEWVGRLAVLQADWVAQYKLNRDTL